MAIIQEMLTNNKETCTLAENIAYYILNTDKSKCRFCGGTMVRDDMVNSIAEVATTYGEKEEVKLRHFVISFSKNEQIDEVRAKAIGVKII